MEKIKLTIECPQCKKEFSYEIERSELEERQREEKSMGDEIEYSLSGSLFCPFCDAELEVEVFEYPENCFDAKADEM